MGQSNNHTSERQTDQSTIWGNASNGGPSHLERQCSGQSGDVLLHNAAKTKGDISAKALKEAQPADGDLRSEALLPEHDVHFSKIPGKGLPEDGILKAGGDVAKALSVISQSKIITVDNFITNNHSENAFNFAVHNSDFKGVDWLGDFYPGVSPSNESLDNSVKNAMYEHGLVKSMSEIDICASFLRLELEGSQPTSWIHSDLTCGSDYSLVGYMNDSPLAQGGTGFWNHKVAGPVNCDRANELGNSMLRADADAIDRWKLTDVVGYKKNRVVIFPSDRFHSRYPRESWGTTKEDGRLLFVMFFSIK